MEVLRDGTFTTRINSDDLAKGLRSSKRNPRNIKFMVQCIGAVGLDSVLQVIDDLEGDRIDTIATILDAFPYPQIFVFTNLTLICGRQDIYEYDGTLTHVFGPVAVGQLWSAVDFFRFIYMSNGSVSVLRDPDTGVYSLTATQPVAAALCNFNGQVIIGAPTE